MMEIQKTHTWWIFFKAGMVSDKVQEMMRTVGIYSDSLSAICNSWFKERAVSHTNTHIDISSTPLL